MQVQYRPTRGGFECLHLPSIEVNQLSAPTGGGLGTSSEAVSPRLGAVATLRKKTSKLSFRKNKDKDRDRDRELDASASGDINPNPNSRSPPSPLPPPSVKPSMNRTNSSFFSLNSGTRNAILDPDTIGVDPVDRDRTLSGTPSNMAKGLPDLPRSPLPYITGEVTDEVFEATGANERSVRFEVNIVKVCRVFFLLLSDTRLTR